MDSELSSLLVAEPVGGSNPCQGQRAGTLCFVQGIAGVCKARDGQQACWEGRANEVALAYTLSTGSGLTWYVAAAAALLTLVLSLALVARRYARVGRLGRIAILLGLGGSLTGVAVVAQLYVPTTRPQSYAVYAVAPGSVPVNDCVVEPGPPRNANLEWGLRFPAEAAAFGRPALLVVLREKQRRPSRALLVAVDADDLEPLWHLGPCEMNVELLASHAVLSRPTGHVQIVDGDASVLRAWWIRAPLGSVEARDELSVSTFAAWGDGTEVDRITLNVETGATSEVMLPAFPPPNPSAVREPAPGSRDAPPGTIRLLAHGRLYEVVIEPFSLRRLSLEDAQPAATFSVETYRSEGTTL